MTKIVELSRSAMVEEVGVDVAGYAKPSEDTIFIAEGLPSDAREMVLSHEMEHIANGEEGPIAWGPIIAALGGALIGGISSNSAANTLAAGSQAGINEQQRQFDSILELLQPQVNAGNAARDQLGALLGLTGGGAGGAGTGGAGGGFGGSFQTDTPAGVGVYSGYREDTPRAGQGSRVPIPGPSFTVQEGGGYGGNSGGLEAAPTARHGLDPGIQVMSDGVPELENASQAPGAFRNIDQALLNSPAGGNLYGQSATNTGRAGDPTLPGAGGADPLTTFSGTPAFEFVLNRSLDEVLSRASALGLGESGAATESLYRRSADVLGTEFNNEVNRLLALANGTQAATQSVANLGFATGQGVSNGLNDVAGANAAGTLGVGTNLSTLLNDLSLLGVFGGSGGGSGGASSGFTNPGLFDKYTQGFGSDLFNLGG